MKRTFEDFMEEFTRPGGLNPKHYHRLQSLCSPLLEGMGAIRALKRRKTTSRTFADAEDITMFRD